MRMDENGKEAPRSAEDFAAARQVVVKRLIEAPRKMGHPGFDSELFMQYTTILDALKIAEAVARLNNGKERT